MNKGKLFMLPVPIADGVLNDTLPEHTIQTAPEILRPPIAYSLAFY